jgi:ferredoxin
MPRSVCPRCLRSITVNRDGAMRTHFCPHYHVCESGTCATCAATRSSASTPEAEPASQRDDDPAMPSE